MPTLPDADWSPLLQCRIEVSPNELEALGSDAIDYAKHELARQLADGITELTTVTWSDAPVAPGAIPRGNKQATVSLVVMTPQEYELVLSAAELRGEHKVLLDRLKHEGDLTRRLRPLPSLR